MKKFILAGFMITIILIAFFTNHTKKTTLFHHKCNKQQVAEDYYKVHIPIYFIPGREKCLDSQGSLHYRDLKEFIITKNNKYCLWGGKNWNEECQNASMAYAYGDYDEDAPEAIQNYKKFKQTVIDFIKYVQENDIEKALALTHNESMFFTDDQANCLVQEQYGTPNHCRTYFKRKNKGTYGTINLKLFRENLMQIDVNNIKFYLDDLSHRYIYNIVIPYEYKGTPKYFDIRFDFGIGGGGPTYPYDNECYPKIYDLGINSELPNGHSYY